MNVNQRSAVTLGLMLALVLLTGCRRQRTPTTAEDLPLSEADYAAARARLQQLDPTAQVGRVIAVLPDEHMVAVGDINVQAFQRGDVLQVVGANDQPVASGTVLDIVDNTLHLRYAPVGEGGRQPFVGDVAIRFTMPVR